jgi:hypothetical protein
VIDAVLTMNKQKGAHYVHDMGLMIIEVKEQCFIRDRLLTIHSSAIYKVQRHNTRQNPRPSSLRPRLLFASPMSLDQNRNSHTQW